MLGKLGYEQKIKKSEDDDSEQSQSSQNSISQYDSHYLQQQIYQGVQNANLKKNL